MNHWRLIFSTISFFTLMLKNNPLVNAICPLLDTNSRPPSGSCLSEDNDDDDVKWCHYGEECCSNPDRYDNCDNSEEECYPIWSCYCDDGEWECYSREHCSFSCESEFFSCPQNPVPNQFCDLLDSEKECHSGLECCELPDESGDCSNSQEECFPSLTCTCEDGIWSCRTTEACQRSCDSPFYSCPSDEPVAGDFCLLDDRKVCSYGETCCMVPDDPNSCSNAKEKCSPSKECSCINSVWTCSDTNFCDNDCERKSSDSQSDDVCEDLSIKRCRRVARKKEKRCKGKALTKCSCTCAEYI